MRVKGRQGKSPQASNRLSRKVGDSFKPFVFPEGMVMVVDTREQIPMLDKLPKGLVMTRNTLTDGDYSILGFEDVFAIERKRVSDFHSYITSERKRTEEKLKRFKGMEFVGLVVEADEDELHWGNANVPARPEEVRQSLVSFEIRYGLHVYVSPDRERIERKILDWAIKFYRIKKEA